MTGEINRVPTGLLNLLDLAARGQTPRVLSPQVEAGLDILELYLQDRRRQVTGSSSNVSLTGVWSCNIPVPQTEYWWVHNFSVRSSAALAAATTYRVVPCIRPGPSGVDAQATGDVQTFTTGERVFLASHRTPFIVPPGSDFLIYAVQATLGTSQALVGLVDYTPLSI